jgi:hypothetical protein
VRTICVLLLVAVALTAALAACGGGGSDDRAKVEASLRDYLSTLDPQACVGSRFCQQGVFPLGAGPPRVRENSCKKLQMPVVPPGRNPKGLSGWSCVVTFGSVKTALPVAVAVKGGGEVYWAAPVSRQALSPATVYEGGP